MCADLPTGLAPLEGRDFCQDHNDSSSILLDINYIGPSSFSRWGLSRGVIFLWGSALGAENSKHCQSQGQHVGAWASGD